MPGLTTQQIPVLIRGLSQKSPNTTSVPGELVRAENLQILKGSDLGFELSKRYGTESINRDTFGQPITTGRKLGVLGDELVLQSDDHVYTRTPSANNWIDRGQASLFTVASTTVAGDDQPRYCPSTAIHEATGLQLTAWIDGTADPNTTDQASYSIVDRATGAVVVDKTPLPGPYDIFFIDSSARPNPYDPVRYATNPRVLVAGDYFLVFYGRNNRLSVARIPAAHVQNTAPTIFDLGIEGWVYDVAVLPENTVFILNKLTLGAVQRGVWDPVLGTWRQGPYYTAFTNPPTMLTILDQDFGPNDGARTYYCALADVDGVKTLTVDAALSMDPPTLVDAGVAPMNLVGYRNLTSTNLFYDDGIDTSPRYNTTIRHWSSATMTPVVPFRGLMVASRLVHVHGAYHLLTVRPSDVQPTFFLVNLTTNQVVGKALAGDAGLDFDASGTYFGRRAAPEVVVSGSALLIPVSSIIAHKGGTATTAPKAITAISMLEFDTPASVSNPVQLGPVLHFPGSVPYIYDSADFVEAGFLTYPEAPTLSAHDAVGANLEPGSRSYIVTYAWVDAAGQLYRSAPSPAATIVVASGSNRGVDVAVQTLRQTLKTNVSIEIWRNSVAEDAVYRLVTSTPALANDPGADSVTFWDKLSDVDQASREKLPYGTGGELENIAPPPCTIATQIRNRVYLAGLDADPSAIQFSKEWSPANGVSYSDFLQMRVTGEVTAVAQLDVNTVIFTDKDIWLASGALPDATGGTNPIPIPDRLPHAVGALSQDSVVVTSIGIFFQSRKGIFLLDRGNGCTYVGAGIEDTAAGLTVTGGLEVPTLNQIRLYTAEGTTLVYETTFKTWTTLTGQATAAAGVWGGVPTFVDTTGVVKQETPGAYADDGAFISSRATFAFASFAGIRGYQRLKALQVLGQYRGPHQLNATLTYDQRLTPSTTYAYTFDFSPVYGTGLYGTGIYGGGEDGPEIAEIRLQIEKCSSVQLDLWDTALDGTPTGGFTLTAFTAKVGVEPGLGRIGPSARMIKTG